MINVDASETGKIITQLRKMAGYTQKTLADALGVTDKAVSKWERGLACPDIALLPKLSVLLDTDIESVLTGSPVHHEKNRKGLLVLEDKEAVRPAMLLYDKPLVYYLLSYFLLVGIKEILIVSSTRYCTDINNFIGNGTRLGLEIKKVSYFNGSNLSDVLKDNSKFVFGNNIMFLYGSVFLYGLSMTRQLQTFMMQDAIVTRLVTYGGSDIPLLFCRKELWNFALKENFGTIEEFMDLLKKKAHIKQRRLGRGMISFHLSSFDDVTKAALFVQLVEKTQGEYIAGLEEIVWRRGLISKEQLFQLGQEVEDVDYREYIFSLVK